MTRFGSGLLAAAVVLLAGCASMRGVDGAPISAISTIAGTWTGTVTPGRWGVADPFNVTITPDGQLTAAWDSNTAWGTVTVRNGQASFEMHPMLYEGTIRLYEDGGRRQLLLDDRWQPFTARVVPQ
jgi:hypothetical protein